MTASPVINPLLRDDAPDSVALSLSSLTKLANVYGRDSHQYVAGLHLVDALIPRLLNKWNNLWVKTDSGVNGRVASQLVLLGSSPVLSSDDKHSVVRHVQVVFPEVSDVPFYPYVYLPAGSQSASLKEEAFQIKCQELAVTLKHSDFSVYCSKLLMNTFAAPSHLSHLGYVSLAASGTTNSNVTNSDIQRYQIALWTSILLVAATFIGAYAIAFMTFKKDSLIYGSFNPHWEDRKRGK